jgi:hypothetical protein
MTKIEFEFVRDGLIFRDAIVLTSNHDMTDAQIEQIKQQRFDAWWAIVTEPSAEEEQ